MLKWTKNSKSMSGSYSMKGTVAADVGRVKKTSRVTNGNGPPILSYPADPPDDENMNEIIGENIDLSVLMPDGKTKHQQSIESNIPMMDLLVNLAATYKLNPAAHTLVVQTGDKWKQIDFKANKTIGLLADENQKVSVQIVRKQTEQKVKSKSTAQPFEMTYRFTVNLPQNQKTVLRISPKLSLGEVRQILCQDKGYDPTHYVFLLPGKPKDVLNDAVTVGDLKSSEINFVSITMLDAAATKSLPDLAFAASHAGTEGKTNQTKEIGQMPAEGQKKAKSRFLSFLGKKDKKLKVSTASSIEESSSNRPKKSESFNVRPKTVYTDSGELDHFNLRNTTSDFRSENSDNRRSVSSSLLPVNENVALNVSSQPSVQKLEKPTKEAAPKKSGKKRAAPPPPQAKPETVQVEIEVKPKTFQDSEIEADKSLQEVDLPERVPIKRFHSRNSSDSSGYHELTLSGADSPDGAKLDNLQTTLDTTSINSADHFNGDSGIRDMSPVRSRAQNRVNGKPGSRDSSLDIDKSDGPIPAGKKKKRAPLPPPDVSAQAPVDTKSQETVKEVTKVTSDTDNVKDSPVQGNDTDDELEAIKAMEEVTMKFNLEDSEDEMDSGMKMVEDSSIHSEDLDADLSHRQRPPATFIAPPPPTEPPPADSEPVDINLYGTNISTTDIGVGDDTTASPRSEKDSAKTSPINNELQKEMGEFKDKINQLAEESPDSSGDQADQIDSNNSNSSFIVHETVEDSGVSSDRASGVGSTLYNEGNQETSEITYEFTIDAVPAEFQNKDEEEEEEFFEEEIVEILPADPQVFNTDSPRRIPDLDSPKEHKSISLMLHDSFKDEPIDKSTPKDLKQEIKSETADKPEEKEEFVISLDELSNVDFGVAKAKDTSEVTPREVPKVNYRIEFRNSRDYDTNPDEEIQGQDVSQVQQVPMVDNDNFDNTDGNKVKDKCSELRFSPDYEAEVEHVMEEKSISMIALPAERTPVKDSPETTNDITDGQTYASSTKIVLSQNNSMSSQNSEVSPRKDDNLETQNLLQTQYQQLQQQFAVWQGQLVQNQQLLATNQNAPGDDQSNLQLQQLQLQIQMQQQMLLQLQQNMHALTLQNSLAAQQSMAIPAMTPNPVVNQPVILPTTTVQTQSIQVQSQRPASPSASAIAVKADIPNPPPPPPAMDDQPKKKKTKQRRIKERALEPREQLMLDIRNFGKTHLKKVPVKATHWHK